MKNLINSLKRDVKETFFLFSLKDENRRQRRDELFLKREHGNWKIIKVCVI